jgi:putative thiamine transport system substrate-binding protein
VRAEKAGRKLRPTARPTWCWINGENFLAMKREGLLFGPFAEALPELRPGRRHRQADHAHGLLRAGGRALEAPWGMAQFTLYADRKRVPRPPRSMAELLDFARSQPGPIQLPAPAGFHGTTFLKQALIETECDRKRPLRQASHPRRLCASHGALVVIPRRAAPAPVAQRPAVPGHASGDPPDGGRRRADDRADLQPQRAANEVAAKRQAETVYSLAAWRAGHIGNTHFLAIPFNARAKEGAQVVINFLLSPWPRHARPTSASGATRPCWPLDKLPASRARPASRTRPAPGQVEQTAPVILEPHGSLGRAAGA